MKKLIIILISCLVISNAKANSDSLNYSLDSNNSTEINSDSILMQEKQITELIHEPIKNVNKLAKQTIIKKNSIAKPMNWFSDAWDFFIDLFKPVHGLYKEDGYRNEGPYFLFDRIYDGGATYTRIQMQRIREFIALDLEKDISIYEEVFALAGTSTIENCNGVIIPNPWDGSKLCLRLVFSPTFLLLKL